MSRFLKCLPALALALWCAFSFAPAQAADELYTVSGVHVDASAASSAEAANIAIAQGRPKAWQILYRRLTREEDWPRQPALDPATLVRLSRSYIPANERRSTTRYVADVTYEFNPEAVGRVLRDANIAFAQGAVHRILLVPMSPAYNNGPWAQAFSSPSLRDSVVPFVLPSVSDAADLSGMDFDGAGWDDVAAAAARANATEAALVQVLSSNGKVTVNIRRLGQGEAPAKTSVEVPLMQTVSATYPAAAQAAMAAIDEFWKTRAVVNVNSRGTLIADVQVNSLDQWGVIQTALAGLENVTGVQVVAMDVGYARLSIAYQGSQEQLRDAMNGQGLALSGRPGAWMITRVGDGR
ncbi:MAG TPA: hypothetical protein VN718_05535 [Rhizomicrobium sp.]|nr:hypothetical protein [Rhizomicrobium sp.]